MATLLLVVIYVAYIGLGLPDSLFGTAWPAIYQDLNLPISLATVVTTLNTICSVASSLFSAGIINRFGTAKVTAVSTTLTAVALMGHAFSGNVLWLCFWSIPLGLGAGAVDTALNNYVALHYKASHMNFLHCFYGVGISLSPYLMSMALGATGSWQGGYRMASYVQFAIAAVTIIALPVWKKAHATDTEGGEEEAPRTLSVKEMLKIPSLKVLWFVFCGSCAIEFTCGVWGSTFLVEGKGMAVDTAALVVTFYFAGMALGRFLSGILTKWLTSWKIIFIGEGVMLLAIIILALPLPPAFAAIALFMMGLGNGPIYPNLTYLTPENFGRDVSQSVMGSQMAAAYVGIIAMPPIYGFLAEKTGTGIMPVYLFVLYVMMIAANIVFMKMRGRKKA